jgi:hypothetical protein
MEDLITIWTPVLISKLSCPYTVQDQRTYHLDQHNRGLEDIKIKIKKIQAKSGGKEAEVKIELYLLFLLSNRSGEMQLLTREEKLLHHIPSTLFSPPLADLPELDFKVKDVKLNWEGELQGRELSIKYELEYMVLVMRDQAVTISQAQTASYQVSAPTSPERAQAEIDQLLMERDELRRQIFCYERDINSLKKSIYKTENRNAALNREVTRCHQLIEQLRQVEARKHLPAVQSSLPSNSSRPSTALLPRQESKPLTARLKRMFIVVL